MRPHLLAITLLSLASPLSAQLSDACSPGWSLLNQLREELTPDTPKAKLELDLTRISTRLRNCRQIPDLWYYRYLVADRVGDKRDADYALKQATDMNAPLLLAKAKPLDKVLAPPAPPLSKTIHDKWALVVGIGDFQDKTHAPPLHYTVDDATAFASYLTSAQTGHFAKDHVISLVNQDATLLGIRTAIGKLREKVQPDDLVVVYMASHGSPRESDPNGVSYIITYDTKLDSAASLYATSLQMIDLVELLRRDIKARRVALVLDTCFSGDATGSRGVSAAYGDPSKVGAPRPFSAALDGFTTGGPRVVVAASRANQESWETDQLKHGYFTYFLLQALSQNNGQIGIEKAFEQARDRTQAAVQKDHHAEQTPTIQESENGGALILGAPPGN